MDLISALLLTLSASLSAGRNIFSKSVSGFSIGTKKFFLSQALIFGSGSIAILLFGGISFSVIAPLTLLYALIYAALLLAAQWCYTAALKNGKTAVCSTVYSLGFILPTLSGAIFWQESLTAFKILGILTVIPAIIISGTGKAKNGKSKGNGYILPLVISMLASGGLGIMQKVQQSSAYPEQKGAFLFFAFVAACAISALCLIFGKKENARFKVKESLSSSAIGICFASCNILNTTLAGRLDSAIFFPALNIGTILLSMLLGMIIYKEKLTKKDVLVLLLGFVAILLINLKIPLTSQ